jgi:hypothetical protein
MKTKHTPKPWRTVPSTSGGGTSRMDIVSDGGEFGPSFVAGDILPEDAKLMAAAPELLEALVNAYMVMMTCVHRDKKAIEKALQMAVSAHAKASL